MVWIITCNKNNGAVGKSSGGPETFNTEQEAHDWISKNKRLFPDCKLYPEEFIQNKQGIINPTSTVLETKEPPEVSGYQLYMYDFTNF